MRRFIYYHLTRQDLISSPNKGIPAHSAVEEMYQLVAFGNDVDLIFLA